MEHFEDGRMGAATDPASEQPAASDAPQSEAQAQPAASDAPQSEAQTPACDNVPKAAAPLPEADGAAAGSGAGTEADAPFVPWHGAPPLTNKAIRQESWGRLRGSYGKLLGAQAILFFLAVCALLLTVLLSGAAADGAGKSVLTTVLAVAYGLLVSLLGYGFSMQCLRVWHGCRIRANEIFAAFSGGRFGAMLLFALLSVGLGQIADLPDLLLAGALSASVVTLLQRLLSVGVLILQLCLALTPFLLMIDTCKTLPQAVKESFHRMRGGKWSLFCHVLATYWWLALLIGGGYGVFIAVGLGAARRGSISGMLLSFVPLLLGLAAVFFLNPRCTLSVTGWMAQRIPEYRPAPPAAEPSAAPDPAAAFTPEEQTADAAAPAADAAPWDPSLGAPPAPPAE